MDNLISEWGGDARCITSDGRNVNMADELNRLEQDKILIDLIKSSPSYVDPENDDQLIFELERSRVLDG